MAETTSRGGFVTDLTLTGDMPASGCCGGPATQSASNDQASSCCGEPVAVAEPEDAETESSDGGCCGPAAAVAPAAVQTSSSCC